MKGYPELIAELAATTPGWYDLAPKQRAILVDVRRWQEEQLRPRPPEPARVIDLEEHRQRKQKR